MLSPRITLYSAPCASPCIRDPIDRMITYFTHFFRPSSFEADFSLAIQVWTECEHVTHGWLQQKVWQTRPKASDSKPCTRAPCMARPRADCGRRSLSLALMPVRRCPVAPLSPLSLPHLSPHVYVCASPTLQGGREGARLTHNHERQYAYVLQSLTLWREISTDMFRLWYLAEEVGGWCVAPDPAGLA